MQGLHCERLACATQCHPGLYCQRYLGVWELVRRNRSLVREQNYWATAFVALANGGRRW